MATQRTQLLPRSCSTSKMRSWSAPGGRVGMSLYISRTLCGGNSMSMTCASTGYHLKNLCSNACLACFVIRKSEIFNKIICIIGSIFHSYHLGGVETRDRLKQRLVDQYIHITW